MSSKPKIFIYDDFHPEDNAMLQALYSRSPDTVINHIDKVKSSERGSFMEKFYIGYGHSSIGDCGDTTIFIEQVSMLVAKAIQDNPLYSGQEASTRYLDYSKQGMYDPYNHSYTKGIQNEWMRIYNDVLPFILDGLKKRIPFDNTAYKTEKGWEATLKARSFDICRSLLPFGTKTLLSWHTNLRQLRDKLSQLKYHPSEEVRDIVHQIYYDILKKYPNSFNGREIRWDIDRNAQSDVFGKKHGLKDHYLAADDAIKKFGLTAKELKAMEAGDLITRRNLIDIPSINVFEKDVLRDRPKFNHLPRRLMAYGNYNHFFLLDFGSFRDIQRHRNSLIQIPLVDGRFGMQKWYMEQFKDLLPVDVYQKLCTDIDVLLAKIKQLDTKGIQIDPVKTQYLYPMGINLLVHFSAHLPQMVYVGELRSSKTVHPSLRPFAQKFLKVLQKDFPGIALHGDFDVQDWCIKRGSQTITEKK